MHIQASETPKNVYRLNIKRVTEAFPARTLPINQRTAAAVALLIVEADGELAVLLTRLTRSLMAHLGQWALPGGRLDAG